MATLKLIKKLEEELKELKEKCVKLHKFIGQDNFNELDPKMQNCLTEQLIHMENYADCLISRIELLKTKREV